MPGWCCYRSARSPLRQRRRCAPPEMRSPDPAVSGKSAQQLARPPDNRHPDLVNQHRQTLTITPSTPAAAAEPSTTLLDRIRPDRIGPDRIRGSLLVALAVLMLWLWLVTISHFV